MRLEIDKSSSINNKLEICMAGSIIQSSSIIILYHKLDRIIKQITCSKLAISNNYPIPTKHKYN